MRLLKQGEITPKRKRKLSRREANRVKRDPFKTPDYNPNPSGTRGLPRRLR